MSEGERVEATVIVPTAEVQQVPTPVTLEIPKEPEDTMEALLASSFAPPMPKRRPPGSKNKKKRSAKAKAKAKAQPKRKAHPHSISLTAKQAKALRKLGKGNLSAGVRVLLGRRG